jgi:outer membrane receptor protein involved in Fe transport
VRGALESTDNADLGYSLSGVVNVPLGDNFAIRATAYTRTDEGYIDSIGNNPIPSLTDPENNIFDGTRVDDAINSLDTYGARVSALFLPTDNFSLELIAMNQSIESDAPDNVDADPVSLKPLYGGYAQSQYHPNPNEVDYEVYSAVIDWDFGAARLESVTSWSDLERNRDEDIAWATFFLGTPFSSTITFLLSDPAVQPFSAILDSINSTEKFTQEFRLLSQDSEKFEWLLGIYYTDEESLIDQDLYAVNAPGSTRTEGLPSLLVAAIASDYQETAAFANATLYINDSWELSFGGRWSENDQSALQSQGGLLLGGSVTLPVGESSESPFTWSIGPRYQVNDNASLYARVATGYRPGGPNILPPGAPPDVPREYASDELTTYEVGYKMNSPDGDFSLDVAAYFLDWEDIQVLTTVNQFTINANGGTAESKGFELAAGFHPLDGLSLSLNAAYTKAKLTEDILTGGRNGDPLPYVPEWTFGASGDYEWVTSGGSTAYFGGNVGYVDDRPSDVGADARTAESYTTVGLRAGMIFDRWSVEVYAKNLTDDEGYTNIGGEGVYPNALGLALIRPRTFGLALAARF